ncbi:hypothetical protein J514_4281 [Acinetobacter sp. 1396970]|nr:hypothetical protein J514_4281 [Acinetobacter sp. 1396970]
MLKKIKTITLGKSFVNPSDLTKKLLPITSETIANPSNT